MISDARELTEGAELTADLCIVGAGPAGITLALALRDAGLSVLVLEGGGETRESRYQDMLRGNNRGLDEMSLDRQRVRALGGSSQHWAGFCLPLAPEDFEARDWVPNSGWPIEYADVLPYYRRAQAWLELPAFSYGPEVAARATLDSPRGGLTSQAYQFSPPTRFAQTYAAALVAATEVTVLLHANVTELVLEAPGLDRIDHLEVAVLDGPRVTVRANTFVLAAGGLENTRLLLASDRQRPEGVANGGGLVGRYLMDHPHHHLDVSWIHPEALDVAFYRRYRVDIPPDVPGGRVSVQGVLGLRPEVREELGLLDFGVTLRPRNEAQIDLGPLRAGELAALASPGDGWFLEELTVRAEQAPRAEQRVELNGDRDALGVRRLDVYWTVDDEDRRQLARGLTRFATELSAGRHGRVRLPIDAQGRFSAETIPGPHHMGTTRMAADPSRGVVDADARTFEVANLYVAGSSVFTTGGRANPTLTLIALAERLADHLRGAPYEREEP